MSKPVYKVMDSKGRVLIPRELRLAAGISGGDILALQLQEGNVSVRKVEIVEIGDQSPEAVEAYVRAAIKTMPDNRIFTDKDCVETGTGCLLTGKVVVLKESALKAGFSQQLYYCTGRNGANVNVLGQSVFLVNLKSGEFERCLRDHVLGVLKPELLPDEEKLQLSQIRPAGALPLESNEPQYSGYSFLEDGRYAAGVWLCNEKEAMEYVEMQKPYQHRVMLCDRNDFCVWEVRCGEQIYPSQEALE